MDDIVDKTAAALGCDQREVFRRAAVEHKSTYENQFREWLFNKKVPNFVTDFCLTVLRPPKKCREEVLAASDDMDD